jgi:hypothetical protein
VVQPRLVVPRVSWLCRNEVVLRADDSHGGYDE